MLVILLTVLIAGTAATVVNRTSIGYKNVAYFPNWVCCNINLLVKIYNLLIIPIVGNLCTQLSSPESARWCIDPCHLCVCQHSAWDRGGLPLRHLVRHWQAVSYRLVEWIWSQRLRMRKAAVPPEEAESQAENSVVNWWMDVLRKFRLASLYYFRKI